MADETAPNGIARPKSRIPAAWLDEIERRLLAAEAPGKFVPELAQKFGRHKRKVWNYVRVVRERLVARAATRTPEADREIVRAMALESYELAKSGSKKFGPDIKGMVAATKVYAEITGVIGPRKVEITGANGGPIETTAKVVMLPALELENDERPGGGVEAEPGPADRVPVE